MIEKTYETPSGIIHYWTNDAVESSQNALIFLPGLTADHRLFEKQIEYFKDTYIDKGIIPQLKNKNEVNLFNTFRSYIDIKSHFPVLLEKHCDERGLFVETMKLGIGGQISFSTTKPCVTRGNHFHTRKIERFTVIRGKAKISLRKIGNNETIDFFIDGDNHAYIDMPVWFTHNISNVGDEDLYTQFWINEYYNPDDADTYYEKV